MRRAASEGSLIACEIVWAELAAAFGHGSQAEETLNRLGIIFSSVEKPEAGAARTAWRECRKPGGPPERPIRDLFVGAHALWKAGPLLPRGRRFCRPGL